MIGYSEVIQTMAAMIIFSIILLNANSMMHRNTTMQITGELEQQVISIGQEIIEEARTKAFDRVTYQTSMPPTSIPGGFTPTSEFPNEKERSDFIAFEDYHEYAETVSTTHGEFTIDVEVFYVDDTNFEPTVLQSTFKKIEVTIRSAFLTDAADEPRSYKLEFLRNYYAD